MARRPKADSAMTIASILEAARSLLKDGPHAVTLRSVARKAGLSMGTIAYYFEDREGLLEACLDEHHDWLDDVRRLAEEKVAGGAPLSGVLEEVVRLGYRELRSQRAALRLRRIIALQHGELIPRRREHHWSPALDAFATAMSTQDPTRARLIAQSLLFVVARYCLLSEAEMVELTGCENIRDAEKVVEDHLVWSTRRLVADPPA